MLKVERLQIDSIIGFGGSHRMIVGLVPNGLLYHTDALHKVYSLGSTVVITDIKTGLQNFLQGHTDVVTCIAISKDGKYIASGQADIIIWDFATNLLIKRLSLHKVKVQSLSFSPSGRYLVSLGGIDDNSVIVWDLQKYVAICGSPASSDSSGVTLTMAYSNCNDNKFVTGGDNTIRVWDINPNTRKIMATDCQTGQIKRIVNCVTVDQKDEFIYCGTTTGDLLQISMESKLFKIAGPVKEKEAFSMGILSVTVSPKGDSVVVGSGDGTVALLALPRLNILKAAKVDGKVTSISFESPKEFLAGTSYSNIYALSIDSFSPILVSTSHYSAVNDVEFPPDSSDLFATASNTDIRIWNSTSNAELLRIRVPNLECKCLVFKKDGSSLITGWNDGKIRAFGPQSGRLQYTINDAHKSTVTALAVTPTNNNNFSIISGGADGQIRIWSVTPSAQTMVQAMKEHKGMISCIKIRKNGLECISSSSDGSCIIWDLTRFIRNQVLFAPSFFQACCYYPDESQILTSGTDRKVSYWEAYDGSVIRELQASQSDTINGLDITKDGRLFVIGGSDKLVKVFRYEEGDVAYVGFGHSTDITKVRISPDGKKVVTVSAEGAIFIWNLPIE